MLQNRLQGEGVDKLIATLPDLAEREEGEDEDNVSYGCIYMVNTSDKSAAENVITKTQVKNILAKSWRVMDYENEKGEPAEYEGEGEEVASLISIQTALRAGESIRFEITANGAVTFDGLEGQFVNGQKSLYKVTKNDIILKGDITALDCSSNGEKGIMKLDVSKCPKLKTLKAWGDALTELDLTQNREIEDVNVVLNKLHTLKLNHNPKLAKLRCHSNALKRLDVSDCVALQTLECHNNKSSLAKLNLWGCTALESLHCYTNGLTELDLSACSKLRELKCRETQLEKLDLAICEMLEQLDCSKNKLTKLDITNCRSLERLICDNNKIEALDLTNALKMTDLYCIDNALKSLDVPVNGVLSLLNCSKNKIETLTLINCANLKQLFCSANQLQDLDLTGCTALVNLTCFGNQLKGNAMQLMINTLPTLPATGAKGNLVVIKEPIPEDGNWCTPEQVASARDKNWEVYMFPDLGKDVFEGLTSNAAIEGVNVKGYPSPAIKVDNTAPNATIELHTLAGESVLTTRADAEGGATLSVAALPKGAYLLIVDQKGYPVQVL